MKVMYLQDIGLYAWLARGSSLGGEWLGPSGHGPPWEVVWISIYYGMLLPVVVCFQSYMTCLMALVVVWVESSALINGCGSTMPPHCYAN
jgi:hypothetical protein